METEVKQVSSRCIELELRLVTKDDLYLFRKAGFLYFVYDHTEAAFKPYPYYTHKGMDIQAFYDLFNLERIFIPKTINDFI
ncbi:MAG: hypothetical protein ACRCVU_01545 [Flavobacterium sp.]|uniref:hypothetical protein n=1 Tax=Myroides marinus TaxID=703342 RepID=UPI0025771203|nr:hypothetical protein [Myroides marinus]MDM1502290.1 hypothetical protein [Myroides marinus]